MTIVTKPLTSEKKPATAGIIDFQQPLVKNNDLEKGLPPPNGGLNERYHYILRTRSARVSSATTLCLLITALLVMTVGLFGGIYVYRQLTRSHIQKLWCNVPFNTNNRIYTGGNSNDELSEPLFSIPQLQSNEMRKIDNDGLSYYFGDESTKSDAELAESFYRENFELDIEDEMMAKIEVPDFKNGRMGRFIHEFDSNKTAIVDQSSGRCFVMPLDREKVLPPKTMFDMIQKMSSGYYSVNTKRVRETMRVVQPPIDDLSDLGEYIKEECKDKMTYRLEKTTNRIVKRSAADNKESKPFYETVGYYTIEYDIVNLDQL